MDSDKRGTMMVMIAIFNDSILGNTANDSAGFISAEYSYLAGCDRIFAILSMVVNELFCLGAH